MNIYSYICPLTSHRCRRPTPGTLFPATARVPDVYESTDRFAVLFGRDREQSVRWLRTAGWLFVATAGVVAVGFALSALGAPVGGLAAPVLGGLLLAGLLAGASQAYYNDGLAVCLALALAPVAGMAVTVSGALALRVLETIPASGNPADPVTVFGSLATVAVLAGNVAFLLGAGARRFVEWPG